MENFKDKAAYFSGRKRRVDDLEHASKDKYPKKKKKDAKHEEEARRRLGIWRKLLFDGVERLSYVSLSGEIFFKPDCWKAAKKDKEKMKLLGISAAGPDSSLSSYYEGLLYEWKKRDPNPTSLSHWFMPRSVIREYESAGISSLHDWQATCLEFYYLQKNQQAGCTESIDSVRESDKLKNELHFEASRELRGEAPPSCWCGMDFSSSKGSKKCMQQNPQFSPISSTFYNPAIQSEDFTSFPFSSAAETIPSFSLPNAEHSADSLCVRHNFLDSSWRGDNLLPLVYCAPTAGGKSLVAEIIILRALLFYGLRAIIVLPHVSLCVEKVAQLNKLWGTKSLGLKIKGFHSNEGTAASWFEGIDVAVCTIEKANSIINRLIIEERLLENVGTFVFDELHFLADKERGYLLEFMLSKLKILSKHNYISSSNRKPLLQIVGLSATLTNTKEISSWLNSKLFVTASRPTPLNYYVKLDRKVLQFFPQSSSVKPPERSIQTSSQSQNLPKNVESIKKAISGISNVLFTPPGMESGARLFGGGIIERILPSNQVVYGSRQIKDNDHLGLLVGEAAKRRESVLVFCATKQWCRRAADHLSEILPLLKVNGQSLDTSSETEEILRRRRNLCAEINFYCSKKQSERGIGKCLMEGIAYHHAGLPVDVREMIEEAFRQKVLLVLCATSTLAVGVNLPVSRVIIRSLQIGGQDFIDSKKLFQMAGRAGRGVSTDKNCGEAFILLSKESELFYVQSLLMKEIQDVQSCLADCLLLVRFILELTSTQLISREDEILFIIKQNTLFGHQNDLNVVSSTLKAALDYLFANQLVQRFSIDDNDERENGLGAKNNTSELKRPLTEEKTSMHSGKCSDSVVSSSPLTLDGSGISLGAMKEGKSPDQLPFRPPHLNFYKDSRDTPVANENMDSMPKVSCDNSSSSKKSSHNKLAYPFFSPIILFRFFLHSERFNDQIFPLFKDASRLFEDMRRCNYIEKAHDNSAGKAYTSIFEAACDIFQKTQAKEISKEAGIGAVFSTARLSCSNIGSAIVETNTTPWEGLELFAEIFAAFHQGFYVKNLLHLAYISAINLKSLKNLKIPWKAYLGIYDSLDFRSLQLANFLGISRSFIMRHQNKNKSRLPSAINIPAVTKANEIPDIRHLHQDLLQKWSITPSSNEIPDIRHLHQDLLQKCLFNPAEIIMEAQTHVSHVKFFVALIIIELYYGASKGRILEKYNISSDILDALQGSATAFCGIVAAFAEKLGPPWNILGEIFHTFLDKLSNRIAASSSEIRKLCCLASVDSSRADALSKAGLSSIAKVSSSSHDAVFEALAPLYQYELPENEEHLRLLARQNYKRCQLSRRIILEAKQHVIDEMEREKLDEEKFLKLLVEEVGEEPSRCDVKTQTTALPSLQGSQSISISSAPIQRLSNFSDEGLNNFVSSYFFDPAAPAFSVFENLKNCDFEDILRSMNDSLLHFSPSEDEEVPGVSKNESFSKELKAEIFEDLPDFSSIF